MTKADLITKVAGQAGLTKTEAGKAIDAIIDTIKDALKKEEKVTLVGFGSFHVLKRKARKGRNPRTGQEIKIPATKIPKFVAGKLLKEAVK